MSTNLPATLVIRTSGVTRSGRTRKVFSSSTPTRRIPPALETGAARMLAVGYGLTFGGLYTLLRPKGGSPFVDGVILGIVN